MGEMVDSASLSGRTSIAAIDPATVPAATHKAIRSMSSDLQAILSDCDVPPDAQARLAEYYPIVRNFARMGDDIKSMRHATKEDCSYDHMAGVAHRVVHAAWDMAQKRSETLHPWLSFEARNESSDPNHVQVVLSK